MYLLIAVEIVNVKRQKAVGNGGADRNQLAPNNLYTGPYKTTG